MIKEAVDDIGRYRKDKTLNNKKYEILGSSNHWTFKTSARLRVGDVIKVH